MEEHIWIYIVGPIVSAFVSWFFTRRSSREEIRRLKTENNEKGFEYLKTLNDDLEARIKNLQSQSEELFKQVVELTKENRELKLQVETLSASIEKCKERLM